MYKNLVLIVLILISSCAEFNEARDINIDKDFFISGEWKNRKNSYTQIWKFYDAGKAEIHYESVSSCISLYEELNWQYSNGYIETLINSTVTKYKVLAATSNYIVLIQPDGTKIKLKRKSL